MNPWFYERLRTAAIALAAVFLLHPLLQAKPAESRGDMELSIRQLIAKYYTSFNVGASSSQEYMKTPDARAERFFNEFSYNTPENSFKISTIYNKDGKEGDKYKPDEYRYFIEQARKYKQVIRAHGPISPQTNKWSKEDNRTPAELDGLLTIHLTKLCKELEENKDVVISMDVVNECFAGSNLKGIGYDGSETDDKIVYHSYDWFGPRKGDLQWENPWTILGFATVKINGQELIIPEYIVKAFTIATKNAPGIKLIWNDHGKVIDPKLYEKLGLCVLYLRSIGLRVDGIGWQGHVDIGWEKDPANIKNMENVIDWCHQNKLEFHVTELDVTVATKRGTEFFDTAKLASTRQGQSETFAAVLETLLKKVGMGAASLNFWTMYDHCNKGVTFAGLFDKGGNPNPSYTRVKELLIEYGKTEK
jgi:endo-1,4-beta-xylanase